MRVFVAVETSVATRAALRALRAQLEPALSSPRPARVTWVNPDLAHVTLRFVGEVADGLAPALVSALGPAIPIAPFDVRFDRLGSFPGARRPQTIWLGASADSGLGVLAGLVNDRLTPLVGPGDARPFRAHVTVARVRDPGGVRWPSILATVAAEATITPVTDVRLMRSALSPRGPIYTELARTALAAPSIR